MKGQDVTTYRLFLLSFALPKEIGGIMISRMVQISSYEAN